MDSTTQYMLALLRASLNETTPNLPTIDTGEWERIYWLARKHGVVTMVNDAIEKLPSEQQPQGDIALSWTLSAERTRYHYAHQTEVLQAIDQKARAENLPYILLKGMTLAKLYPRPDSPRLPSTASPLKTINNCSTSTSKAKRRQKPTSGIPFPPLPTTIPFVPWPTWYTCLCTPFAI